MVCEAAGDWWASAQAGGATYLWGYETRLLLTHGLHNHLHLLALGLATLVRAKTPLGELEGALEGGRGADLDELNHTALVRSEPRHLTDDLAHKLDVLADLARAGGLLAKLTLRRDEALVAPEGEARGGFGHHR